MHTRSKFRLLTIVILALVAFKFYHYNYVANTRGQARTLKDAGLKDFVCKGAPYTPSQVDQCGSRSIYGDADWGITAYITIYGVDSQDEAEDIAKYVVDSREKNSQQNIPINLKVYSVPRSTAVQGSVDTKFMIFDKTL